MNFYQQSYMHALAQGNWSEAYTIAQSALANTPLDAEWFNRMGYCALIGGQTGQALECFDAAVQTDPYLSEALLNGAILLAETGFYEEARNRFEAARVMAERLEKGERPAGFYRTVIKDSLIAIEHFCDIEDWAAARDQLLKLLEMCDSFSVRLRLADVFLRLGEVEQAKGHIDKVARTQLGGAFAVTLQIQMALRQNRLNEARQLLEQSTSTESMTFSVLKQLVLNDERTLA